MERLEKREKGLENNCTILTKQLQKDKEIIPFAEKMVAVDIDKTELLAFDTAVNEMARQYNLPLSVAAFRVIRDIQDYNKIGVLKKELSRLCQQIFVINGV
jgi:hypothetical protein